MSVQEGGAVSAATALKLVRGCEGCTLCCKVMEVKEIAKPGGTWCRHCKTGAGCTVYDTRPEACAAYVCGYLTIPELTPEWRPAVSRLIISSMINDSTIVINVDPARPDAWRRQPYYDKIRFWAREAIAAGRRIVVYSLGRSIVILPDHAVDLGPVGPDELIVVTTSPPQHGAAQSHEAYAVKRDAWAKAAAEMAERKLLMPDTAGFRSGRRID